MTEQLEQDAINFVKEVEAVAKDQGYQAAKEDFDSQYAMLKDEYESKIKKAYDLGLAEGETAAKRLFDDLIAQTKAEYESKVKAAYTDGYNARMAEESGTTPDVTPVPEPIDEPVDDPVNEGYNREKVISELLAIKGSKSFAFGIVDVRGNVYANPAEWTLDNKPEVLGIGYTDGSLHLCMLPKKAGATIFGFNGVKVAGVYYTKGQWKKDSKANAPSAYEDYSGASNSDALVKAMGSYDSTAVRGTAIYKAHSLVAANGKKGYLPPCGEMRIYCRYHKEVDELLTAVGGDKIRNRVGNAGEGIWTSTGLSETQGWIVLYSDNNTQPAQRDKNTSQGVRAFVEL